MEIIASALGIVSFIYAVSNGVRRPEGWVRRTLSWLNAKTIGRFRAYVEAPRRDVERLQQEVNELKALHAGQTETTTQLKAEIDDLWAKLPGELAQLEGRLKALEGRVVTRLPPSAIEAAQQAQERAARQQTDMPRGR